MKEIRMNLTFEVGQLWACGSKSSNKQHEALVINVEKIDSESIIGVAIVNDDTEHSPFMPFSYEAFSDSIVELRRSNLDISDFVAGYLYWKKLYIEGEAGVYTITVDNVMNLENH